MTMFWLEQSSLQGRRHPREESPHFWYSVPELAIFISDW